MGMGEGVRTRSPRRLTRSVNSPKPWDVSAAYTTAVSLGNALSLERIACEHAKRPSLMQRGGGMFANDAGRTTESTRNRRAWFVYRASSLIDLEPKSPSRMGSARPATNREQSFASQLRLSAMSNNSSENFEPRLQDLLGEPIVHLVMQADNVDEHRLRTLLEQTAARIRNWQHVPRAAKGSERDKSTQSNDGYRLGVGIMLLDSRRHIFLGQRIDVSEEAWQMPQGGIEEGETAREAALRELQEELGTSNADDGAFHTTRTCGSRASQRATMTVRRRRQAPNATAMIRMTPCAVSFRGCGHPSRVREAVIRR